MEKINISDKLKNANECTNMSEVRHEIDKLDIILVNLIAKRQSYMDAAARIKGKRELIRDEARVEDVVEKVIIAAKQAGLAIEIAEPVWRTMIEQCINYELQSFEKQYPDNI